MESQANERFLRYNAKALSTLFDSFTLLRVDGYKQKSHTWSYEFRDCVVSCLPSAVCGDMGGRTTIGQPCGRKSKHGRCASHRVCQHVSFHLCDGDVRPFPTDMQLSHLVVDGVSVAVDVALPLWVSAEHAWSAVVLDVKQQLDLPSITRVRDKDQRTFNVDPLWPTNKLLNVVGQDTIHIHGRRVTRGHVLRDYGVEEGMTIDI